MKFVKNNFYLLLLVFVIGIFFWPFLLHGKLPFPADTLVGLYHPWRDDLKNIYSNGYPYKNPLITDPVRQQYPNRLLAISLLKQGKWPTWNPYAFSGTPLLANIQTAIFYPGNILFWIFSPEIAWSFLILLQPLLASIFTYLYLKHLNLDSRAAFVGSISFAFSGFMIAWQTWNTIGHVALWLPLILLAKDKLIEKFSWKWVLVLIFAESSLIVAGHFQTAFYLLVATSTHALIKIWYKYRHDKNLFIQKIFMFIVTGLIVLFITCIQWLPTLHFILQSAREFDLPNWQRPDWFIPWQHLLQFIAPDFFGNPATGNYWGVWNYGEFVGYIGLIPLLLAFLALVFRRDQKTFFFGLLLFFSLMFGLPTIVGKIPYQLSIPFLSTLQPSRIMVLIDFSLSILSALGFDHLLSLKFREKKSFRQLIGFLSVCGLGLGLIWLYVSFGQQLGTSLTYLAIAKRNLILPSLLLGGFFIYVIINGVARQKKLLQISTWILLTIIVFDLLRFGQKYIPFVDKQLVYPQTQTTDFLQKNIGEYRLMTTDRRIIPPNVSTYYKLQSVDGYDPLYLKSYGELVASWTRNKPDITPAAFNRILTPEKYDSFLADFMGVKYILTLKDETSPKLKLVLKEDETRIYENKDVYPRAFLVNTIEVVANKNAVIEQMFNHQQELRKTAFTDQDIYVRAMPLESTESAQITYYSENKILVQTEAAYERLLVLTDIYYPDWNVFIDNKKSSIFLIDLIFRGVIIPPGVHQVEFKI